MSSSLPQLTSLGWQFAGPSARDDTGSPLHIENTTQDKLYGSRYLRELYLKAQGG